MYAVHYVGSDFSVEVFAQDGLSRLHEMYPVVAHHRVGLLQWDAGGEKLLGIVYGHVLSARPETDSDERGECFWFLFPTVNPAFSSQHMTTH